MSPEHVLLVEIFSCIAYAHNLNAWTVCPAACFMMLGLVLYSSPAFLYPLVKLKVPSHESAGKN